MPVSSLDAESPEDFSRLGSLAEEPNYLVTMRAKGGLTLYYRSDCRFLDSLSGQCRIHNSEQQPQECKDYLASKCWYTHSFASRINSLQIQLSPSRIAALRDASIFDDTNRLYRTPPWERSMEIMRELKGPGQPCPPTLTEMPSRFSGLENHLLMELPETITPKHRDLMKFRLGFPGIWVVGDGSRWAYALPLTKQKGSPALDGLLPRNSPDLRARMEKSRKNGTLLSFHYGNFESFPWDDPEPSPLPLIS
ncbi:hypothetical protein [Salinispira pacifica]|uniref:Uncharacterized protein n=1 Tax=Salinispira pacifica TaxID=1307761 RepID=V5WDQ9_9SPIO|nr:hypothetical protein [Salinispira pacifica]AHC13922.1 hypothetical protein L21SP2_0490 [Salinispira pacifica]